MTGCPICDRPLEGGKVDDHHLIPKLKGGKNGPKITIHRVCHDKIHSVFTEQELAAVYNTPEALRDHPEIAKFVRWVKKKPVEFNSPSKLSSGRKRK